MLKNLACLDLNPDNLYYPPKRGGYVYFEGPAFGAIPGLHYANASWAADADMFAYARYGKDRSNEVEFKGILRAALFTATETIGDCFVGNATTARGFFGGNDNFAILAFRGTEKDNPNDIAADLEAIPLPERALPGGPSAAFVHQGFQRYLGSVWTTVVQLVGAYRASHPNQEICVTGHSLGAALATLAFQRLRDVHSSLYTFGCPRVGNQAFCDDLMLAARTQSLYRVVDNEDVVTHIPIGLGYKHPNCTAIWIDANSQAAAVRDPASLPDDPDDAKDLCRDILGGNVADPLPRPLADHSPVRYCHWISKQANPAIS